MSDTCDYCYSRRGVETYSDHQGDRRLCQVCSRLHGTGGVTPPSLGDLNRNIVTLFHTLDLIPHNTDDEGRDDE